MEKTNVMRLLEAKGVGFTPLSFDGEITDGVTVAKLLGKTADEVFKTLVTTSGKEHFVFVIPVSASLNLKLAAKAVGAKSIEMIKQKDLLPLTGYVHGGCSPIGMKKPFKTVVDETAVLFDQITFSAGKIGYQAQMSPLDLAEFVGASFAPLTD